jgi:hypothetical protein
LRLVVLKTYARERLRLQTLARGDRAEGLLTSGGRGFGQKLRTAVVEPADDGFIATFFDGNISTTGDTEVEAVSNLRSLILDTFEYLDSEHPDSLGPEPARHLAVLRVFVQSVPQDL